MSKIEEAKRKLGLALSSTREVDRESAIHQALAALNSIAANKAAEEGGLPALPPTTYNAYGDGSEPLWTKEQMEYMWQLGCASHQSAAGELLPNREVADEIELLSRVMSEHPQLKPVIGREALLMRCVRKALVVPIVARLVVNKTEVRTEAQVFFNGEWKPATAEAFYCMTEDKRRVIDIAADRACRQVANKAEFEPVGEVGPMPGTSGFTMACFKAEDVPIGTKLYATPPATTGAMPKDLAIQCLNALDVDSEAHAALSKFIIEGGASTVLPDERENCPNCYADREDSIGCADCDGTGTIAREVAAQAGQVAVPEKKHE